MAQSFKPAADLEPARPDVMVNIENIDKPPLLAGCGARVTNLCLSTPLLGMSRQDLSQEVTR